ncbi:hypothetical protein CC86DRAFT_378025 [Ophiobolus disseminans]|uniref:Uncharacterized protein n=1 Tax=Ophiobolus disseminans TaxID=1469910 RepID=A0A6A7ACT0_9PLEO|nr:hypothetical protein CC86DRAFT_378025 [Ophiobolus disseminans]
MLPKLKVLQQLDILAVEQFNWNCEPSAAVPKQIMRLKGFQASGLPELLYMPVPVRLDSQPYQMRSSPYPRAIDRDCRNKCRTDYGNCVGIIDAGVSGTSHIEAMMRAEDLKDLRFAPEEKMPLIKPLSLLAAVQNTLCKLHIYPVANRCTWDDHVQYQGPDFSKWLNLKIMCVPHYAWFTYLCCHEDVVGAGGFAGSVRCASATKVGKPKGCKNKKTIEKLNAIARLVVRDREAEIAAAAAENRDATQHTSNLSKGSTKDTEDPKSGDLDHDYRPSMHMMDGSIDQRVRETFETKLFAGYSGLTHVDAMVSPQQDQDELEGLMSFSPLLNSDGLAPLPNYLSTRSQSGSSYACKPETCDCLERQSSHLCELPRVERQSRGPQLDATMRFSSNIFRSLDDSSICQACTDDPSVPYLIVLVLRLLLRVIGTLCRGKEGMSVQFGNYSMNQEECAWMNMVIMARLLTKCRTIIELLKRRMLGSGRRPKSVDAEYFGHVFRALAASVEGNVQHLNKKRLSSHLEDDGRTRHDSIMSHGL